MGDYPTSRKLCPESDGIKLVSWLVLRLFGCGISLYAVPGPPSPPTVILENDLLDQSNSL
jgi:hypothetical protein